jgi:arginyl-tRNA synthetase
LYQTIKKIEPSVLGDLSFEEFYVPFGKMLNMSTRNGKIEFLSDLIKESKEVALESIAKTKSK